MCGWMRESKFFSLITRDLDLWLLLPLLSFFFDLFHSDSTALGNRDVFLNLIKVWPLGCNPSQIKHILLSFFCTIPFSVLLYAISSFYLANTCTTKTTNAEISFFFLTIKVNHVCWSRPGKVQMLCLESSLVLSSGRIFFTPYSCSFMHDKNSST